MPVLNWNSRLSSTAGRFCPGSRLRGTKPIIEVAGYLRGLGDGEQHIRDTMLHEMIHYWLWHRGRPYGHTPEFYEKMQATGAKRFNPVPKVRPVKYHYECPECRVLVPARRRLENVACFACCKSHNFGEYSKKFRLLLVANPLPHTKEADAIDCGSETAAAYDHKNYVVPFDQVLEKLKALRNLVRNASIRK